MGERNAAGRDGTAALTPLGRFSRSTILAVLLPRRARAAFWARVALQSIVRVRGSGTFGLAPSLQASDPTLNTFRSFPERLGYLPNGLSFEEGRAGLLDVSA